MSYKLQTIATLKMVIRNVKQMLARMEGEAEKEQERNKQHKTTNNFYQKMVQSKKELIKDIEEEIKSRASCYKKVPGLAEIIGATITLVDIDCDYRYPEPNRLQKITIYPADAKNYLEIECADPSVFGLKIKAVPFGARGTTTKKQPKRRSK